MVGLCGMFLWSFDIKTASDIDKKFRKWFEPKNRKRYIFSEEDKVMEEQLKDMTLSEGVQYLVEYANSEYTNRKSKKELNHETLTDESELCKSISNLNSVKKNKSE